MAIIELIERNSVIKANGFGNSGVNLHITTHGSNWTWTVFSIFGVLLFAYVFWGISSWPRNCRAPIYTSIIATIAGGFAYFAISSNLGWAGVPVEFFRHGHGVRQVFYARYIGWFVASTMVVLNFSMLAGIENWWTNLFTIGLIWTVVVGPLVGAVIASSYRWGFYVFGAAAGILVAYQLAIVGYISSGVVGADCRWHFQNATGAFLLMLALYAVCWGLSEGGNVLASDSECVWYGVLDICTLVGINTYIVWAIQRVTPERLGLVYGQARVVAPPVTKGKK